VEETKKPNAKKYTGFEAPSATRKKKDTMGDFEDASEEEWDSEDGSPAQTGGKKSAAQKKREKKQRAAEKKAKAAEEEAKEEARQKRLAKTPEQWLDSLGRADQLDVEEIFDKDGLNALIDEFRELDEFDDNWLDNLAAVIEDRLEAEFQRKKEKKKAKKKKKTPEDWFFGLDENQQQEVEEFFVQEGLDAVIDEFPVLDSFDDNWLDQFEDFLKDHLAAALGKKKTVNKRDPTREPTPEPEPEPEEIVPTWDDDSDSDGPSNKKSKPAKKKVDDNRQAAFAFLMDDDDEEEDMDDFWGHNDEVEEEEPEPEPELEPEIEEVKVEVKKEPAWKNKKKKKKKQEKKEDDDFDIMSWLDNENAANDNKANENAAASPTSEEVASPTASDSPGKKKESKAEKRRLKRLRQKEKAEEAVTSPEPKEKKLTAQQLKRLQAAEEYERQQAEARRIQEEEEERIRLEEEAERQERERKKQEALKHQQQMPKRGKKKGKKKGKAKATKRMGGISIDVEERKKRAAENKARQEAKKAKNKSKANQRRNADLLRQQQEEAERKRREEEERLAAEAERRRQEEEERRRIEEERLRRIEEERVMELERLALLEADGDSVEEPDESSDGGWDEDGSGDAFDDESERSSGSDQENANFDDESEASDMDEPVIVEMPEEIVEEQQFDDESEPEIEEEIVIVEREEVEEVPQGPTDEEILAEFIEYGFSNSMASKLVEFGFESGKNVIEDEDMSKEFLETLTETKQATFLKTAKLMKKAIKYAFMKNLRAPIGVIMGNVNAGKTALLDNVRGTKVQEGEAGGITQQIGATNLPMAHIVERAGRDVVEDMLDDIHVPGLLIIDTPGHAAFDNLRARGSSMCDIAIVVVNIFNGMEGTTAQCVQMLRDNDAPFIVALNQIDRLGNDVWPWQSKPGVPIRQMIEEQDRQIKNQFNMLVDNVKRDFAEQLHLNAYLFWESEDLQRGKTRRENINMVPTSAFSGDGVSDMLLLWVKMCQMKRLAKKIVLTPNLNCTVLECKKVPGLGFVVDVILSDGTLHRGDTIVLCGINGAIVTRIRALLQPTKLQDLRVKADYTDYPVVKASCGVRISTVDSLEHAIPGAQVYSPKNPKDQNEVQDLMDLAQQGLEELSKISTDEEGVFVVASTLGALVALAKFLTEEVKVKIAGTSIGDVHKKQVMQASVMLEKQPIYAVIIAFDVDIKPDAAEYADYVGVQIFRRDIIYQLQTDFADYYEAKLEEQREAVADDVVFPVVLKIYEEKIFRRKNPLLLGCQVTKGTLKMGTPLVAMNPGKADVFLGQVTSIQENGLDIPQAEKGMQIAVKISLTNENSTIIEYGRHFSHANHIASRITRRSLDVIKQHYRKQLTLEDVKLLRTLKQYFEIK